MKTLEQQRACINRRIPIGSTITTRYGFKHTVAMPAIVHHGVLLVVCHDLNGETLRYYKPDIIISVDTNIHRNDVLET